MTIQEINRLPPVVRYAPHPRLGLFLPLVVSYKRDQKSVDFYVNDVDFTKLDGSGSGWLYGRTPWGPWCHLKLWRYRVQGYYVEQDPDVLNDLNTEMAGFDQDQRSIHKQLYGKEVVYLLDYLFKFEGEARYKAILEAPEREIEATCVQIKKCSMCPLAIHYSDRYGIPRLLCVDVATDRRVQSVLKEGGRFTTKKG